MKTRIILMIVSIAIAFAFTACGGDDDDGDKVYVYTPGEIVGTGTSNDPFHVHDVITLSSVGKTPEGYDNWTLTAHYKQVKNIDLAEIENWEPIGTYISSDDFSEAFNGTYDGGGYTIKNLTIDATTDYQGLFGCVGTDGIVKNVGVIDCDITSTSDIIGGIVGYNYGIVSNCYSTGNVSSGNLIGGGVVGANSGTVSNCYSTGNVSVPDYAGGIVGLNYYGTVSNCYATGNVSGIGYVGGVAGYNLSGTISNCVALNGSITRTSNTSTYFGRVVGYNNTTSTNNYANSAMTFIDGDSEPTTTFPTYAEFNGTDITSTQWSNPTWWTQTAGWDASIWDFSNISATSYPKLR